MGTCGCMAAGQSPWPRALRPRLYAGPIWDNSAAEAAVVALYKWTLPLPFPCFITITSVLSTVYISFVQLVVAKVLKAKSSQYLTDYHLWLSAFVKPSYSRFSRSQRLTCCLCLIMLYMTVACLWCHYFINEVDLVLWLLSFWPNKPTSFSGWVS